MERGNVGSKVDEGINEFGAAQRRSPQQLKQIAEQGPPFG